jgi:hypothetical protein
MFTLDVSMPEVEFAMFAQCARVVVDMDIWHKHISHVNEQRLKSMQNSEIVTGLPKFKVDGMHKICEACQFGKQTKNVFPHDKNVSNKTLDVMHLDVGGQPRQCQWEDVTTMYHSLMTTQGKCGCIS